MPQLPERPDLDQLRRRARELHRAAAGGDARSLRRLQAVSARVTLSAAQLAIAREHGFPSWPKLKAEVERRRSAASPAEPALLTAEAGQLIDAQYAGLLAAAAHPGQGAERASAARPGDGTGQKDLRLPGLAPPDLRGGAGDHQDPGRSRPAARWHRARRPPADGEEHRRRDHAYRAHRAR